MTSEVEEDQLLAELRISVSAYLSNRVTAPAMDTVSKDIEGQARIASLLRIARIVCNRIGSEGVEYDAQYLKEISREEIEERILALGRFIELEDSGEVGNERIVRDAMDYLFEDGSRKHLLVYFERELNWIVVSILSASYISSFVLMRSVFELTVGIATRNKGGMKERLLSIAALDESEGRAIKDLWYRLCAWGHPFEKWQKEICPVYVSHDPMYHSRLFSLSISELTKLLDFFLVVVVEKYRLDFSEIRSEILRSVAELSGLELFEIRSKR